MHLNILMKIWTKHMDHLERGYLAEDTVIYDSLDQVITQSNTTYKSATGDFARQLFPSPEIN